MNFIWTRYGDCGSGKGLTQRRRYHVSAFRSGYAATGIPGGFRCTANAARLLSLSSIPLSPPPLSLLLCASRYNNTIVHGLRLHLTPFSSITVVALRALTYTRAHCHTGFGNAERCPISFALLLGLRAD